MLGFESEEQYFDYFFDTLLKTNWTYDYFVEWKKVKRNIEHSIKEISLLNSLSKISAEKRRGELKTIFQKYPETVPIIPSIIAMREQSISLLEMGEKTFYRVFNFNSKGLSDDESKNLVDFCEKVGILSLFSEINDLYAYLLGVEVGLDSNARKNRSGTIFQELLRLLLNKTLQGKKFQIRAEDPNVQTARSKRADFVIYSNGEPRVAIECNFYNTTGSKPIEVANSYIDFQRKIRENPKFSFIWVTDGPAWQKMSRTVRQCFREIDFPINYTIAEEKINSVFSALLK